MISTFAGVSYIDGKFDFHFDTARQNELILEAYGDLNDDAAIKAPQFPRFCGYEILKGGHKELSAALTVDINLNVGGGRLDDGRLSFVDRGIKFKDVVDAQFKARAEVSPL